MGRKNGNARRRYNGERFGSFEELKAAGVRFDLSNGDFIMRKSTRKSPSKNDVGISIINNGGRKCLSFSFSAEKADDIGDYVKVGIVKNGIMERLYILPADCVTGYKFTTTNARFRKYVAFPIEPNKAREFEEYIGDHELKHDFENDAHYVTKHS